MKKNQLDKKIPTFTNLTPRRGSLPVDHNRPLSPAARRFSFTSTSSSSPNFQEFKGILEEWSRKKKSFADERENNLENVLERLQNQEIDYKKELRRTNQVLNSKNQWINKLDSQISQLEIEKQAWKDQEDHWKKIELTNTHLEAKLVKQNQELDQLKNELKEVNDDFYQFTNQNVELSRLLNQEKLTNQRLEQQFIAAMDENHRLRDQQKANHQNLLTKINELSQLRKINQAEREQLLKFIAEQQVKFEEQIAQQAKELTKQYNSLRSFVLKADLPTKFKRTHKPNLSTGSLPVSYNNSPRDSFHEDDKNESPTSLFAELTKGNIFNNSLTSSPLANHDNDPMEEAIVEPKNKRHSNSPFFVPPPSPQNSYNDLVGEVEDFVAEASPEAVSQVLQDKTYLEAAYKDLKDKNITNENLLKGFVEKELTWQNEKQKLQEELNELKYKLAESQTRKRIEDYEQVCSDLAKTNESLKISEENNRKLQKKVQQWQELNMELNEELEQKKPISLTKLENESRELSALIEQAEIILKIK